MTAIVPITGLLSPEIPESWAKRKGAEKPSVCTVLTFFLVAHEAADTVRTYIGAHFAACGAIVGDCL